MKSGHDLYLIRDKNCLSLFVFLLLLLPVVAGCGHDSGTGPDPTPALCLDPALLDALDAHAQQLRFAAQLLAGHPGEREAVGFFLFPGLDVQRTAVYAGPLVEACSEPLLYDKYCEDDGLCSRIECTGEGAGWVMHFRLQRRVTGAVDYNAAIVDTAWADGDDGITFEIGSTAGDGDRDWSVAGDGRMDIDSVTVTETYAELAPEGSVVLTLSEEITGTHAGTITVAGQVVAIADPAAGRYRPAEGCGPP